MNETLLAEDLSEINTRMLLPACRENFTVKSVERDTTDKGDGFKIVLNSTKDLTALDGKEILSTAWPHNARIFMNGNDSEDRRTLAQWCQGLGVKNAGPDCRNFIGQTGPFNVTIKGEFNRFRPVAPNGK